MAGNLIIRQLGPVVNALSQLRQAIYRPPQTRIAGLDETLWPNPLQPVTPMGPPRAEPLGFPFNWGQNLVFTPRSDAEYSAEDLRRFAKYPLARICIENTKDMVSRMPHRIQLKPLQGETSKERRARGKNDATLKKLNGFFDRPNREQNWEEWIRPTLDDMLTIDAASTFVERQNNGSIIGLRWIEGASITRLVDEHGWTPMAPSPAYHQLYEGYPRIDLTTDQLVYKPRNIVPRNTVSSYLYGYSPTEQIVDEVKVGIARLNFVLDFYTEGSIPGGMLFAPIGTPADKIKEAQQFLDSDLAGQLAKRRRLQILQGFQTDGKSEQLAFPKEPALADSFDDLHIRKICFAYGTSPQRLMRMMNRASAETNQESAELEGTLPWMQWLKGLIDYIIQVLMGYSEYEFAFDPFHESDVKKQAEADKLDVETGLYTINEKREDRGDDPRQEPEADQLNVLTASGMIPLGTILKPTGPAEGAGGGTTSSSKPAPSKSTKTNGHTKWTTCAKHYGQYPRSHCTECIESELALTAFDLQRGQESHV